MALSGRRRLFVDHYIETRCNGAEAARRAGYGEKNARIEACRLLKDPEIQEAISEHVEAVAMGADEVLLRLAEQARGEITEFIVAGAAPYLDVKAVAQAGKLHLIKGISYTKSGDAILQTYDAQAALVQIGRHHQLFTDRVDLTSNGKDLTIVGIEVVRPGSDPVREPAQEEGL